MTDTPPQPAPPPYVGQVPTAQLVLPPGVTLATPGRRIGAYFLSVLLAIVTLGIGWMVWGLVVWDKGTSPALQVLGMKAYVPREARRARWGDMALRDGVDYLVAVASCAVSTLVSFVMFLVDDQHRSLADRIGSTVIVHDPQRVLG